MMRIEQEAVYGKAVLYTLEELWEFKKELKEAFGEELEEKLADFAENFRLNPKIVPEEDRDIAYKIFWMMKLIPSEPNQN
mgnify:CR=1 FL=1